MEILDIIEEKDNKFFNRKEIKIIVGAEKTPSYQEVIKFIAEKYNEPDEKQQNIIIKQIKGKFGKKTFLIISYIYNSIKDKEKSEPKKKVKKQEETKNKEQKQETTEEKPKQEPKKQTTEKPEEESKDKKNTAEKNKI